MKASDNPFPYITAAETSAPTAPAAGIQLAYVDPTEHLLRTIDSAGDDRPHWPIYVIPNGGTPPAGLAPNTIILEEGP